MMIRTLPAPTRAARLDELLLAQGERVASHDACHVRPGEDDDHGDHDRQSRLDQPAGAAVLRRCRTPRRCRSRSGAEVRRASRRRRARGVVSDQPPKKPASQADDQTPIRTAIPVAATPTSNDVRAPYIVRTNRSRPAASAPNQKLRVRPSRQAELIGHTRQVRLVGWMAADPLGERAAEDGEEDEHDKRRPLRRSAALSFLNRTQNICRGERLAAVTRGRAISLVVIQKSPQRRVRASARAGV